MNLMLKRTFRISLLICFVTFIVLYISHGMGYYEYQNGRKVALTNEQIRKFEEDIAAGKNVDVESYVYVPHDYQNKVSRVGLKVSNVGIRGVQGVINKSFKLLGKLAE